MGLPEVDPLTGQQRLIGFLASPAKPATVRPSLAKVARQEGHWATMTSLKFAGFGRGSWWTAMIDGTSIPLTGADVYRIRSAGYRLPAGGGRVNISVRLWADIHSGQDALCDVEAL